MYLRIYMIHVIDAAEHKQDIGVEVVWGDFKSNSLMVPKSNHDDHSGPTEALTHRITKKTWLYPEQMSVKYPSRDKVNRGQKLRTCTANGVQWSPAW